MLPPSSISADAPCRRTERVIFGLLLLAVIPFVMPIVSLVMLAGMRGRLRAVEDVLVQHQRTINELTKRLQEARQVVATRPAAVEPAVERPAPVEAAPRPVASPPPRPVSVEGARPAAVEGPPPVARLAQSAPTVEPAPPPMARPAPPAVARPTPSPVARPIPPSAPPPAPPPPPRAAAPEPFDWERLIGVKMFSAVAGIALVLAAVFFLRYSIDQGWLGPQVRVAIGLATGIALLAVCELKAARRYPVTANAMDAAAIAILFSTIFAAHALWDLIPSSVTFALLALITAVAVLLSIRRDSLFIAVLGLLGGFATPILLSTGENRPVPLFTYLLLLNIGLAWVASRKGWAPLTILTLAFTTLYQWGWVFRFLSASQLSLAMGIFLVFAVTGFVALVSSARASADAAIERMLETTGLAAAAMPLFFAVFLAAVPAYGARPALLFGFLLIVDAGLLAVSIARGDELAHAIGAAAAVLVFAVWLAMSYVPGAWIPAASFAAAFVVFFALAPIVAERFSRRLTGVSERAVYAAPVLLFVFTVLVRIEPAAEAPLRLFVPLFALMALIAWRALATRELALYFIAAFFGVAAEAAWSATYLSDAHLREAVALYAAFGAYAFAVPLIARRIGVPIVPSWGSGAVLLVSLLLLLFLAAGLHSTSALWGLAVLLAILNAAVFIESAAGELPAISVAGGALSWLVLAVWWGNAAAAVGLLPSLLFLVMLTLTMLGGHAWAYRAARSASDFDPAKFGFHQGTYLGVLGHLFLFFIAIDSKWSTPPWPLFAALGVLTLALTATSLAVYAGELHAAGVVAAAIVVFAWARVSTIAWAPAMLVAAESVAAYALVWLVIMRSRGPWLGAAMGAICALFMATLTLGEAAGTLTPLPIAIVIVASVVNIALIFAVAWEGQWGWVAWAPALAAAWYLHASWMDHHAEPAAWASSLALAASLYAVFAAYPLVLGGRARGSRDPSLAAIAGSAWFFFAGRAALEQGGLTPYVGAVPVVEAAVMTVLLRQLLKLDPRGSRDLGLLALVAGVALAFVTVAIPLQLERQWITIGWALEGAALAWVYRRIPHRGLLYWSFTLLAIVFVRLALNPEVFAYEPRGYRVFNWYLYAYLVCAVAMFLATWWFSKTDDRLAGAVPRASTLLPAAGVILLFLLLNIEIADFYATGPAIMFRFGVTLAQDLTYTIGWLVFGLLLLTAGIYLHNRPARIAAVALIAVTACKAFLYDMGSLGGLYRVFSLVGLAMSLALVALALQKFVLQDATDRS